MLTNLFYENEISTKRASALVGPAQTCLPLDTFPFTQTIIIRQLSHRWYMLHGEKCNMRMPLISMIMHHRLPKQIRGTAVINKPRHISHVFCTYDKI